MAKKYKLDSREDAEIAAQNKSQKEMNRTSILMPYELRDEIDVLLFELRKYPNMKLQNFINAAMRRLLSEVKGKSNDERHKIIMKYLDEDLKK